VLQRKASQIIFDARQIKPNTEHNIQLVKSISTFLLVSGETISILYDPGRFPALGTKNERRNGGVPQEGSIEEHLTQYRKDIDELVPNQNYSGLIVIDFESWRPILRQNTGDLTPYKDYSYEIERQRHPFWSKSRQQAEVSSFLKNSVIGVNILIPIRPRSVSKVPARISLKRQFSCRRNCGPRPSGVTTHSHIASTRPLPSSVQMK